MIPEGWEYEPADYSVGIMADGWYHADCTLDTSDYVTCDEVGVAFRGEGMNRTATTTYLLTCPCGATGNATRTDYDPEDGE